MNARCVYKDVCSAIFHFVHWSYSENTIVLGSYFTILSWVFSAFNVLTSKLSLAVQEVILTKVLTTASNALSTIFGGQAIMVPQSVPIQWMLAMVTVTEMLTVLETWSASNGMEVSQCLAATEEAARLEKTTAMTRTLVLQLWSQHIVQRHRWVEVFILKNSSTSYLL